MHKIIAPFVIFMLCAIPLKAQNQPVVVELFTSQGCSSCPPADRLLRKLASEENIIALSMHVDYWDYLGWKDIFSSSEFTDRQYGYAKTQKKRMVYTPQMMINGTVGVLGSREREVRNAIRKNRGKEHWADFQVNEGNAFLKVVEGTRMKGVAKKMDVKLIRYTPSQKVHVKRGENAGRELNYANIVREVKNIGMWDVNRNKTFEFNFKKLKDNQKAVILVQHPGFGRIEAAYSIN